MKSPADDLALIDKKKEFLEKKRYDQMHKNYNQQSTKGSSGIPGMLGSTTGQNSSVMPNIEGAD